jgi:hypothetical protein
MQKEIKNYLPFYLGCKVFYGREIWEFIGINKPYKTNKDVFVSISIRPPNKGFRSMVSLCNLSDIKLILRPLSDITEEEAIDIWDIMNADGGNKKELSKYDVIEQGKSLVYSICYMANIVATFALTHYLLSKNFDIFGLIGAGLAIDSTTIKP